MWFDIICILIILAGFVFGYRRGFLAQAGSIIGVVMGIILCNIFASRLASHLIQPHDSMQTVLLANIMSYVIIFGLSYIMGRLLGTSAARILKTLRFGFIDKLGGALFTMAEYTLALSLLLNAWIGAFPGTRIMTNYEGVKKFVITFAPTVFGNNYVKNIFENIGNSVAGMVSLPQNDENVINESESKQNL